MKWFENYTSPDNESSIFKGIPMAERNHPFIKGLEAAGCKIRYRGSRAAARLRGKWSPYDCYVRDATSFAVYPVRPKVAKGPSFTYEQKLSIRQLYTRNRDGAANFKEFMGRFTQCGVGTDNYVGGRWCNMFVGIETDGYRHT